jgi:hypothetical protein
VKYLFVVDDDFVQVYKAFENSAFENFFNSYLIKENKLCVSNYYMLELLICEAYRGGLIEYFRRC